MDPYMQALCYILATTFTVGFVVLIGAFIIVVIKGLKND